MNSELGAGTTFALYFPAVREAMVPPLSLTRGSTMRGYGLHLLYLDDEEALVILTTRIFERLGYTVSGFTGAEQALAAFRAEPAKFDLLVTDFNMPGTSGLEVAGEWMKIRPDVSVVLTSGYVTEDLRAKAARIGIRRVIYKPNSVQELCEAVEQVLQEQR